MDNKASLALECLTDVGDVSDGGEPILYRQRWTQLAYLGLLALLSDWVCFSVAAVPEAWHQQYQQEQSVVVDIFLYTNVIFSFLEPVVVAKLGLRKVVVGAAFLMALGCICRSGPWPFSPEMPAYRVEVLGTILVGAAQPFFQCTPPLLSAVWFAPHERVLATSIAINSNQIGIGIGFLLGGSMVGQPGVVDVNETASHAASIAAQNSRGLQAYFSLISLLAVGLFIGAMLQFKDQPPTPPSSSAAARKASNVSLSFPTLIMRMLQTPGFVQPLVTFMASIGITNAISTEVAKRLKSMHFSAKEVNFTGAGFQMAIMFGSIVFGKIVDTTKFYKSAVCLLLVATVALLVPQGYASQWQPRIVLGTLLLLGSCVGPVQPISAELAVEVAYPMDENAIVAFQQVCGNLFSALTIPLLTRTESSQIGGGFTLDYLVLAMIGLGALAFFATFSAPLKRAEMDVGILRDLQDPDMELEGYVELNIAGTPRARETSPACLAGVMSRQLSPASNMSGRQISNSSAMAVRQGSSTSMAGDLQDDVSAVLPVCRTSNNVFCV